MVKFPVIVVVYVAISLVNKNEYIKCWLQYKNKFIVLFIKIFSAHFRSLLVMRTFQRTSRRPTSYWLAADN